MCADFIPFCEGGDFELFYLRDWRNEADYGRGTPWYRISTDDFFHYTEHGEALARGSDQDQDLFVFTGSVIAAQGQYHIFYTGHNPDFPSQGKPAQAVMHAVSDDLDRWVSGWKTLFMPMRRAMIRITSAIPLFSGMRKRACIGCSWWRAAGWRITMRGFTAQYTSCDLANWTEGEPFWAPNLYNTHECPDLFRMGDKWYLVFSEYSDTRRTRYVMADHLKGPGACRLTTALTEKHTTQLKQPSAMESGYLFGWVATRAGNSDDGAWEWGGNLAVHELVQREDGTLGCRMPEQLEQAWVPAARLEKALLAGAEGKAEQLLFSDCGKRWRVDMDLAYTPGTYSFGLSFGQDFASRHGYKLEFLPGEGIVRFGAVTRALQSAELYRRVPMAPGEPLHLSLIAEEDVLVLYVGDRALSIRICEPQGSGLALFCVGGSLKAEDITRYCLS